MAWREWVYSPIRRGAQIDSSQSRPNTNDSVPDHHNTVAVTAADGEGNLFVADWATGVVWKYTSPSEREPVAGGLASPEGIAFDADGSLLVVETGIGQLSRIDPATGDVTPVAQGLALGAQGAPGTPPTWIFNGVAVGAEGAIYVTGDIGNVVYRIEVRP